VKPFVTSCQLSYEHTAVNMEDHIDWFDLGALVRMELDGITETMLQSYGQKREVMLMIREDCEWLLDNVKEFNKFELDLAYNYWHDISDRYADACQMPDDERPVNN
jgi:hypothetical protein